MVSREGKMADKMETVPSAIASATIVGAGAFGLAFAQLDNAQTPRSSSENKNAAKYYSEVTNSSPLPRPSTSAVDTHANPSYTDSSPISNPELHTSGTRRSISRRNTNFRSHLFSRRYNNSDAPAFVEESAGETKESISRPSWIKRISTIPNSQISSPRSSIGPDSPSFSHGSAAPILNATDSPIQLPPNKLVKRATSRHTSNGSPSSYRETKYPPSLRRPATSHQRSATLQQQFKLDGAITHGDQSSPLSPFTLTFQQPSTLQFLQLKPDLLHWKQYFVPRISKQSLDISPRDWSRTDANLQSFYATTKRILPDRSNPPILITANMVKPKKHTILEDNSHMHESDVQAIHSSEENSLGEMDVNIISTHKKPRRTLSKHFSSPPSWKLRSGSIGRRKRQSMENSDDDRNAPMPVTMSSHIPPQQVITEQPASENQMILSRDNGDLRLASNTLSRPNRQRDTSSPLPPLARVSSFGLDLEQIGSYSLPSSAPPRKSSMHEGNIVPMQYPVPNQSTEFGSSPPVSATTHLRSHRAPEVVPSDRASTLVGSDNETRGFYSGEDEDTDFQSETIFDSFRTGTTGSLRIQNPLETMFDTSPSSSLNHSKMTSLCDSTLRGSFHEGTNITEEKSTQAPVNKRRKSFEDDFTMPMNLNIQIAPGHVYTTSPTAFPSVNEDFGRLLLEDDDDDEDWAREAEEFGVRNSLSPPSSFMNSRHVSPNPGAAMVDLINGNTSSNPSRNPTQSYSLLQWSESQAGKKQHHDMLERPKTEHGVQGADSTGLRRKSLLLRTHSVPVVPEDVVGRSKGVKMTEEWEDDFFEHSDEGPDSGIAIPIPLAIQASQANVLGHVSLIRDVLPIVNELKRLRTLAREKDLLDGPHASLWKEAEGIIALASPDDTDYSPIEKDQANSLSISPISVEFDPDDIDDRFRDCGFDGKELDRPDEVLDDKLDVTTVRRQSVFLPGDDIFGHSGDMNVNLEAPQDSQNLEAFSEQPIDANLSKPATFPRVGKDPAAVARSVMETMHSYRSISDPLHSDLTMNSSNQMPFDTTSLRDFVTRANSLIKDLSEILQASECVSPSPVRSPRRAESPAFTRVFTDPLANPPRRLPRSKSNTSNMGGSPDSSPTKKHGKRIHVMTVM